MEPTGISLNPLSRLTREFHRQAQFYDEHPALLKEGVLKNGAIGLAQWGRALPCAVGLGCVNCAASDVKELP